MLFSLDAWNVYVGLAINGVFTGLGAAIGTYVAQSHIIKRAELLRESIRGRNQT